MQWNDSYQEIGAVLHQQHSAEGRRHAPHRPARGDDARAEQVHRGKRAREEGQGRDHRRRHARGPRLRAVGEGARAEVLLADQGEAGVLRGAPGGRGDRRRAACASSSTSGRPTRAPSPSKIVEAARGARSGAQGARDDAPQGRARRHGPARQARRLPGEATRRSASSTWSRATRPAARPSRAATASSRRSCRSRARS